MNKLKLLHVRDFDNRYY